MIENLEKYTDKFGGTWYKVNQENCKNYDGCGIYSYHIDNNTIILDNHISYNMQLDIETIKKIIDLKLEFDTTELLRTSNWEIQLYDKINRKWR